MPIFPEAHELTEAEKAAAVEASATALAARDDADEAARQLEAAR